MTKRNVAIALVAAVVLGGGALALAQGEPDRPSTEPGPAAGPVHRRAGGRAGGPLRRAVHGDLVVRGEGGKFETVTFDRGEVDPSSDGGKVVIERPDGPKVTLQLTPETRYRGVRDATRLRKGEPAVVTSRDGKALTVAQRDPDKVGPGNRSRAGNKDAPPGVPND